MPDRIALASSARRLTRDLGAEEEDRAPRGSEHAALTARITAVVTAPDDPAARARPGSRTHQLMRHATLGALTELLLHDLASAMQSLSATLDELSACARPDASFGAVVEDAKCAGDEAVQLFVWMRKLIRDGEVVPRPVRLDRLVERAARVVAGQVRDRAQLRVGPLSGLEVLASEPMLLHVVVNLLRNAARASPRGGAIDLDARAEPSAISIVVVDDGPGVPPAIAARIFEPLPGPFSGAPAAAPDTAGVGLAISAYVLELMGGRIGYAHHPQRGAMFTVTLPRPAS